MTSSEPKAQISIKQPLLLGVKRNLTCFQQIPCFLSWSLILDWKDSENCCTFQLKLHDLVDLDQLPSPSLFFKLNRHNYSNLPWQSSHCAFSPFPSPPLQPLVLHVSQTVHNSRYGGITIVYRKKNQCNFPSSPWWHSVFAGTSKHLEEFQGEGPEADPWSTTALSWTQGCHGFMFGIFPPLDSLLYTSLHRDYPAFILTCLI